MNKVSNWSEICKNTWDLPSFKSHFGIDKIDIKKAKSTNGLVFLFAGKITGQGGVSTKFTSDLKEDELAVSELYKEGGAGETSFVLHPYKDDRELVVSY